MTGWHPAPARMAFRAAFHVARNGRNGTGGVPHVRDRKGWRSPWPGTRGWRSAGPIV
jgi:hypothetical protein